ncbi:Lysosomal Pro-X carboxypeptidase [Hondaea fermentalgiana]|uniref:Lysosomal Pro-X carboxypeptidase n=1 Tax=Hondaea fermentalgiana TaxID=2315210 RepID=A0A2R5GH06_9STRA|nr:Lysosomal Pro-X carboxypeptidase [Hondaea fermentalgiana]|eukprot:GBG27134.1 Lysosomal Pro-X carboxypeptidase [Hondaea fermentalgiana]
MPSPTLRTARLLPLLLASLLAAASWAPSSAAFDPLATGFEPIKHVKQGWFYNKVDHFGSLQEKAGHDERFAQRFFVNLDHWKGDGYPILFYNGNEADVELYVNATGLIWESAPALNAAIIFAEHRYYGASKIGNNERLDYLTHEQALSDFATLLYSFQSNHSAWSSKTVAIGGSYGGMLALFFRMQYPALISGAIAASAPVLAFRGQGLDFYNDGGNAYWRVVTHTAGQDCANWVRQGFAQLLSDKHSLESIQQLGRLCETPQTRTDVALFIANAFSIMAMGNFPYPSSYLTGDASVLLPAFPIRAACDAGAEYASMTDGDAVKGLLEAAAFFANASKRESCLDVPRTVETGDRFSGPLWSHQYCSEQFPEEFYMTMTGTSDMFFDYPNPAESVKEACQRYYNQTPDETLVRRRYGNERMMLETVSNVVFSNGLADPWSSGSIVTLDGILSSEEQRRRDLQVVNMDTGGHHVDLMFSHEGDTAQMRHARKVEFEAMRRWTRSLCLRWHYSPGVSLMLFLGWFCGCFLPLTVFIPAAIALQVQSPFHVALLLFTVLGLPTINFLGVTQVQLASRSFDLAEKNRIKIVRDLAEAIFASHNQAQAFALRLQLEGVYAAFLRKQRDENLQNLHTISCCGRTARGRLTCWKAEIIRAAILIVFAALPCAIMLPLGYVKDIDLSFSLSAKESIVVTSIFLGAPPLLYLAWVTFRALRSVMRAWPTAHSRKRFLRSLWRNLQRRAHRERNIETYSGAAHAVRSEHGIRMTRFYSAESPGDDPQQRDTPLAHHTQQRQVSQQIRSGQGSAWEAPDEIIEQDTPGRINLASLVIAAETRVPKWILWELFCLWLACLLPLALCITTVINLRDRMPPPLEWSHERVQTAMRVTGYVIPAFFAGTHLLLSSLSSQRSARVSQADVRQYIADELECVWLCLRYRWPLETIGDYPYFSIGEGVVTKSVFYHDQTTISILLRRMNLNLALCVAVPAITACAALTQSPDNIGWVLLIVVTMPTLCLTFYAAKLVVGVTPARRLYALPNIALWAFCGLAVPLAAAVVIVVVADFKYLGFILFAVSPAWFIVSAGVWAYSERRAFLAWLRALTIQRSWLVKVTNAIWKMAFGGLLLMDMAMLCIGALLSTFDARKTTGQFSTLLLVFSLFANVLHVSFYLCGVVSGVIRADRAITSTASLASLFLRLVVFGYACMEMHNVRSGSFPHAGVSSLLTQSYSLQSITFACILSVFVITFVQSLRLYETFALKRQYGYFPADWELAFPPRNVAEQAHRVVEYKTDSILRDLRARGLIEPQARELLRMYIDPRATERERLSVKNRLFLAASQTIYSRRGLEVLLEDAISKDVRLIARFESRLRDKRNRQVRRMLDRDAVLRSKLAVFKGSALLAALQAGPQVDINGLDLRDQDALDLLHDTAGPRDTLLESAMERDAGAIELPELFAQSQKRFSAFVVGRHDRRRPEDCCTILPFDLGATKHGTPAPTDAARTLSSAEVEPSFGEAIEIETPTELSPTSQTAARELFVIDAERHRLISLDFRVWRLWEVSFSQMLALQWFPEALSKADSVRALFTFERSPQASCSIRSRPLVVTRNLYFTSEQERERFCMKMYVLTCLGTNTNRGLRYDNRGTIFRHAV